MIKTAQANMWMWGMISDNSCSSGKNLDEEHCVSFVLMDFTLAASAEGQRCPKICKQSNQERMGKRQTGKIPDLRTHQGPKALSGAGNVGILHVFTYTWQNMFYEVFNHSLGQSQCSFAYILFAKTFQVINMNQH